MTARDLIKGSMRLLGALASGEEPTAAEAQDCLLSLNSLIDSWQTDRLMMYAVLPQTYNLVAGQKSYTLGPGGDFDAVRPVRVDSVYLVYTQTGTPDALNLPVEVIDVDEYNAIVVPSTSTSIPLKVYIDDGYPQRTLFFWPVPSEVQQVEIYTWQQLTSIGALNTPIAFPPGYEMALRFGLAVHMAPEFGLEASPTVMETAMTAKAAVKSVNNLFTPLMRADAGVVARRGGFNWMTGE